MRGLFPKFREMRSGKFFEEFGKCTICSKYPRMHKIKTTGREEFTTGTVHMVLQYLSN